MKFYDEESYRESLEPKQETAQFEFGCGFCWNSKRKVEKELFFFDAANNMRPCLYCPSCGRKYNDK